MKNTHKLFIKVEDFVNVNLPLLLALPSHIPYHDSHVGLYKTNLLVMFNKHGSTRVYSTGGDAYTEHDVQRLFSQSY